MKTILILLGFLLISSCGNTSDCCVTGPNISYLFSLVDAQGNDLLDPNFVSSYPAEDIKIYRLINGEKMLQYNSMSDAPYGFSIYPPESTLKDNYTMRVFQGWDTSEEFPVTYVEWNEEDTDTLMFQHKTYYNSVTLINIWYNDELVWSEATGNPDDRYFEIVK